MILTENMVISPAQMGILMAFIADL